MATTESNDNKIVGNLSPEYWIQKSDPLILMRSVPFSLGELKIMDTYISRINAKDSSRRTVVFTKKEYGELMGIENVNYRILERNTSELLGKKVTLEMPNKEYMQFVLFEKAYYHKNENGVAVVELTCTESAQELFFCIGKYHYYKYALKNIVNLHRKTSYLLYLYVLRARFQKEWIVTVDNLREDILDCKDSWKEYKIFKRDVLDPTVKEINEKTDLQFTYTPIRTGRRITKIKFTMLSKKLIDDPSKKTIEQKPSVSIEELEEDEKLQMDLYGSESLIILAEGVNYEFGREEMKEIELILQERNIPKDKNLDGIMAIYYGRQHYLREMFASMNVESKRKEQKGETIKDRFRYFKTMILKDDRYKR